ncbi:MAG: PTS sugar transporter subunit IIA [Liquorilactobacillus ghanensis]|uniref:PTS sugar transporter subunit IIA n=1 Tax=Liquorilactobacillus ghanensis TaxID=399370 RepID=UPI0039EA7D2D
MDKIDISKVVSEKLITLDLKADTKETAIEELTELLVKDGAVNNKKAFINDVILRESEGVTGLGQGVAIPHGKSKAVNSTSIAVGLSKHSIKWESLDEKPVNLIILFAVKDEDANTLHLKLLQHIAILLADDEFIKNIKKVTSKKEVIKLLSGK